MFHLIFKIIGKILPKRGHKEGDSIRADAFLQIWVLWSAFLFFAGSIIVTVYSSYQKEYVYLLLSVTLLFFSVYGFLAWRNQKINLTSSNKFEYTNVFGKKKEYCFSELTGYRIKNGDITLCFGKDKVKIDKASFMSDRFSSLLKQSMNELKSAVEKVKNDSASA